MSWLPLLGPGARFAEPDLPLTLGRDEAARLARDELANPIYRQAEPPLLQRALQWLLERVQEGLDRVVAAAPGGWVGLLGIVVLVVVAVVVVRWRLGPLGRTPDRPDLLLAGQVRTAVEHRAAAQALAARADWAGAVRERLRAIVRAAEERGVLDPRPGRTADEVARELGRLLPGTAGPLRRAVRVFDEVWYGGRVAGPDQLAVVVAADQAVQDARPATADPAAAAVGGQARWP